MVPFSERRLLRTSCIILLILQCAQVVYCVCDTQPVGGVLTFNRTAVVAQGIPTSAYQGCTELVSIGAMGGILSIRASAFQGMLVFDPYNAIVVNMPWFNQS